VTLIEAPQPPEGGVFMLKIDIKEFS
jgi:hypothetical protein